MAIVKGLVLILMLIVVVSAIGIKKSLETQYIYHITSLENAKKIVQDGYANINGCRGISSYSNFFRKSTFYFAGIPNHMQLRYNLNVSTKKIDKLVAVRIKVSDLPKGTKIKQRLLDGAVFHTGSLKNTPAEIVEIPTDRIRSVMQPFLLNLYILCGILAIALTYEAIEVFKVLSVLW